MNTNMNSKMLQKYINMISHWEGSDPVINVKEEVEGNLRAYHVNNNDDNTDHTLLIINDSEHELSSPKASCQMNTNINKEKFEVARIYILSKHLLDKKINKKIIKNLINNQNINLNKSLLYTYYIPVNRSDKDISIKNRLGINSYHQKKEEDNIEIMGHLFSASIYDIYDLYKCTGDDLFKNNLRIGIKDILNVNSEISKTIKNNPEDFWLFNNGITMTVNDDSFYIPFQDKLVFLKNKIEDISIINGAQTVSNIALTINELENEIKSKKEEEDKETLEKLNNQLDNIKENGKVLLKIIQLSKKGENSANVEKLKSEISVSLNRQKPITQEDIIYTNRAILYINNNFEGSGEGFHIIRRGEIENIDTKHYSLISLARVMLAISGKPGSARSHGQNKLLATKKEEFVELKLFNEINEIEKNNKQSNNEQDINNKLNDINTAFKMLAKIEDIAKINKKNIFFKYGKYIILACCYKHWSNIDDKTDGIWEQVIKIFSTTDNTTLEEHWKDSINNKNSNHKDSNAFKSSADNYWGNFYEKIFLNEK